MSPVLRLLSTYSCFFLVAIVVSACGDDSNPGDAGPHDGDVQMDGEVPMDGELPMDTSPPRDTGDCTPMPGIVEPIWLAGDDGSAESLGGIARPDAIQVDGNLLLVGDEDYQEIHIYDITSDDPTVRADQLTPLIDLGGPGGGGGLDFLNISGMTKDPMSGNLYVVEQYRGPAEPMHRMVHILHPLDASPYYEHVGFIIPWASQLDRCECTLMCECPTMDLCGCVAEDGQLGRAQVPRFDSMGRLYISDDSKWYPIPSIRRDVQVFTSDGMFLEKFGDPSYGPRGEMGNLEEPESIAFDEARDRIYVCDEADEARNIVVYRFSDRSFVTRFGEDRSIVPNGIDIDQYGFIYVMIESGSPSDSPTGTGEVRVFDPETLTQVFTFGQYSPSSDHTPGTFNSPDTVKIDVDQDLIYTSDQGHRRAQGFRLSEIQDRGCITPM